MAWQIIRTLRQYLAPTAGGILEKLYGSVAHVKVYEMARLCRSAGARALSRTYHETQSCQIASPLCNATSARTSCQTAGHVRRDFAIDPYLFLDVSRDVLPR